MSTVLLYVFSSQVPVSYVFAMVACGLYFPKGLLILLKLIVDYILV